MHQSIASWLVSVLLLLEMVPGAVSHLWLARRQIASQIDHTVRCPPNPDNVLTL